MLRICIGCTEPEFPHHDLAPGTVFATPTTLGLPNEVPPGMSKRTYLTMVAAGKGSMTDIDVGLL